MKIGPPGSANAFTVLRSPSTVNVNGYFVFAAALLSATRLPTLVT